MSKAVSFQAVVELRAGRSLVIVPAAASTDLPSRGQVAVSGTLNDVAFETVIEPDGTFGHWMNVDAALQKAAKVKVGDGVAIVVKPTEAWPEPTVPADLERALASSSKDVRALFRAITPMARWEWVRWVNETKSTATRAKRIDVTISKLGAGKRRPCCFNLASCTDPELAKSGKLIG